MSIELVNEGRLARIILDRPPLNILDLDHLEQLEQRLQEARDASIIVLRAGAKSRCFSAGNAVEDHVPERAPEMLDRFHAAIRLLLNSEAITVADVRGDALGGGCELITACDLVYATPYARFGQPEIKVGCFPPIAAALLPHRVGWTKAMEMIATGRLLTAEEAVTCGLVTRVCLSGADDGVADLLTQSAAVLRVAKQAMCSRSVAEAERIYKEDLLPLEDCAEGVRAFLAKTRPTWRHS